MFFFKFSYRAVCAIWFGGLALVLLLPLCVLAVSRFIEEWRGELDEFTIYTPALMLCYAFALYLAPVGMAAFFGSRLGVRICSRESKPSNLGSFILGVRISIATAVGWIIVGILSTVLCGLFFDTSRIGGWIVFLALFGFPVYGVIAGLGGLALRCIVIRGEHVKGQKRTEPLS